MSTEAKGLAKPFAFCCVVEQCFDTVAPNSFTYRPLAAMAANQTIVRIETGGICCGPQQSAGFGDKWTGALWPLAVCLTAIHTKLVIKLSETGSYDSPVA